MLSKTKASANYLPLRLCLEEDTDGVKLESIQPNDILAVIKTQEFLHVLDKTESPDIFLVKRGWFSSEPQKLDEGDRIVLLGSAEIVFKTLEYAWRND